jgi:hypothetical protein
MMKWGSIIFSLPVILLLSLYGLEFSAVNDCLLDGLSYDFQSELCVEGEQNIYSPFYARNSVWVNSMLLLSIFGALMMTMSMIQRGMVRNQ